jgi:RNA polymerase sigma-70 factor (ECF subfamily)
MAEHSATLRKFAFQLVRDRDEASDLYQDTCVRVWRSFGKLQDESTFRAWAMRIMQRLLLDRIRTQGRRPQTVGFEMHGDYDSELQFDPVDERPGPHEELVSAERMRSVESILRSLPSGQGQAVWLRHGLGLKYDEVAARAGCSVGSAKSRVHRGRANAARELEERREAGMAGCL